MDQIEKARELYRKLEGIELNQEEIICRKFEVCERLLTIRSC
jgi:hypothetical protein